MTSATPKSLSAINGSKVHSWNCKPWLRRRHHHCRALDNERADATTASRSMFEPRFTRFSVWTRLKFTASASTLHSNWLPSAGRDVEVAFGQTLYFVAVSGAGQQDLRRPGVVFTNTPFIESRSCSLATICNGSGQFRYGTRSVLERSTADYRPGSARRRQSPRPRAKSQLSFTTRFAMGWHMSIQVLRTMKTVIVDLW